MEKIVVYLEEGGCLFIGYLFKVVLVGLVFWIGFKLVNCMIKGFVLVMEKVGLSKSLIFFLILFVGVFLKVLIVFLVVGLIGVELVFFFVVFVVVGFVVGLVL